MQEGLHKDGIEIAREWVETNLTAARGNLALARKIASLDGRVYRAARTRWRLGWITGKGWSTNGLAARSNSVTWTNLPT